MGVANLDQWHQQIRVSRKSKTGERQEKEGLTRDARLVGTALLAKLVAWLRGLAALAALAA